MERVYRGENITTAQKKRKREKKKRAKVFKLKRADAAGRAEFFFFLFFLISFFVCFRQRVCVCLCACIYFQNHTRGTWASFSFFPLLCCALCRLYESRNARAFQSTISLAALKWFCLCCFSWTQHGDVGVSTTGTVWPKLISYALYGVHTERDTEFLYQRSLVFTSSFVDLQLDLKDHLYSLLRICHFTHMKKWRLNFRSITKKKREYSKENLLQRHLWIAYKIEISFKIKKENFHDICRGNRQL